MIPNHAHERMFRQVAPKEEARQKADPSAAMVPYEVRDVVMWDFNGPAGPQQFMIEKAFGDFVKEEKDRFKIRCRQDNHVIDVDIYKAHLYFKSTYETKARVRITAEPPTEFVPTPAKKR